MSDSESDDEAAQLRERQEMAASNKKRQLAKLSTEGLQSVISDRIVSLGFTIPVTAPGEKTMEEQKHFIPGQSDICAICGSDTPLNDMLENQSCIFRDAEGVNKGKQGTNARHRICRTCWFTGKDGTMAFAAEETNHKKCPGCLKKQPIFVPEVAKQKFSRPAEIIELLSSDDEEDMANNIIVTEIS